MYLVLRNVATCLFVSFVISDTFAIAAVLKAPAPEFTKHRTVRLAPRLGRSIRDKRDIPTPNKNEMSLTIPLNDKDVVLDLKLNFDILPGNLDNITRSIEEESMCEYIGKVQGVATSRAAVSVCGEPAVVHGTVFDGNSTFYIEPATALQADGQEPLYYIYNRRDLVKNDHKCSTPLTLENPRKRRAIFYPRIEQEYYGRRSRPMKAVIRILIVAGASLLRKKASTGTPIKEYIRRLINEVYSYYTDLGITVQYAGSKQILRKIEKKILSGSIYDDIKALNNFNDYMLDHMDLPQEYDVAVFLSEDVFKGLATAGLAFTGSVCGAREDAVAAVTTHSSWFMISTTVAHEVGHLLGLKHEEYESQNIPGCPNESRTKYIMAAIGEPDNGEWSPCSKASWRRIRNSGKVDCLLQPV